jgi:hypothetical protein
VNNDKKQYLYNILENINRDCQLLQYDMCEDKHKYYNKITNTELSQINDMYELFKKIYKRITE